MWSVFKAIHGVRVSTFAFPARCLSPMAVLGCRFRSQLGLSSYSYMVFSSAPCGEGEGGGVEGQGWLVGCLLLNVPATG